jgi:hypothetical protein
MSRKLFFSSVVGVVLNGFIPASALASYAPPAPGPLPADTVGVWVTGAQGLDTGFIPSVCLVNDNLSLFSYENSGQNFWAVYCDINSAKVTGLSPGKTRLLLTKRRVDGSVIGVIPLLYEIPVQQLEVNSTNCTPGSTAAPFKISDSLSIPYTHNCAAITSLDTKLQHLGVSDAEPDLFRGDNVPKTWTVDGVRVPVPDDFKPVKPNQSRRFLVTRPVLAKIQGVPVTLKLRNALQSASFPLSSECNPSNPGYAAAAETAACMPSLSTSQIATLFTGSAESWESFKVDGVALTAAPGIEPPSNSKILLCERGAGIGTQVTFSAKMLNNPCAGRGSLPIAAPGATFAEVILNESFDNMDQCLHQADAAGRWALGITSLDKNVPNASTGAIPFNYRFIRIDGVTPILENVYDSSYRWWEELTAQWRKTLRGNVLRVVQALVRDAAQATTIDPRNKNHLFGRSGYMALSASNQTLGTSNTVDAVFNLQNPVTPYTHSFGNQSVNLCRIPTIDQALIPQIIPVR